MQNKEKEIAFFSEYANSQGEYDVFTEESNRKIVQSCIEFSGLKPPMKIVDLGCGTGVFTKILCDLGFSVSGLDLSPTLIEVAQKKYPNIEFHVGDVEHMPFASESFEGVFLSGILHHLPDPSHCTREVYRVLKAKGIFVAFDPNRLNPFMWLYRDKRSPLYSPEGVTENERPIKASEMERFFKGAGFHVSFDYLSGIHYRYVASARFRWLLPVYNFLDDILFRPFFLKPYRAFVLTRGVKP